METIKIEVIGSGCKKCKALFELTKEVVQELGNTSTVEYSTDVNKIVALGVMSSPVLAINDTAVLAGSLPDKEKLTQIISAHLTGENVELPEEEKGNKNCADCTCGDNC